MFISEAAGPYPCRHIDSTLYLSLSPVFVPQISDQLRLRSVYPIVRNVLRPQEAISLLLLTEGIPFATSLHDYELHPLLKRNLPQRGMPRPTSNYLPAVAKSNYVNGFVHPLARRGEIPLAYVIKIQHFLLKIVDVEK